MNSNQHALWCEYWQLYHKLTNALLPGSTTTINPADIERMKVIIRLLKIEAVLADNEC